MLLPWRTNNLNQRRDQSPRKTTRLQQPRPLVCKPPQTLWPQSTIRRPSTTLWEIHLPMLKLPSHQEPWTRCHRRILMLERIRIKWWTSRPQLALTALWSDLWLLFTLVRVWAMHSLGVRMLWPSSWLQGMQPSVAQQLKAVKMHMVPKLFKTSTAWADHLSPNKSKTRKALRLSIKSLTLSSKSFRRSQTGTQRRT